MWEISGCVSNTSTGAIYKATHIYTSQVVAVKVQHKDDECPTNRYTHPFSFHPMVIDPMICSYERGFYPSLQGGKGMPVLWASGVHGVLDYLVMDLLGPSLDNLYRKNGKVPFDLRSVCCIAIQMVSNVKITRDLELNHHRSTVLSSCTLRVSSTGKLIKS